MRYSTENNNYPVFEGEGPPLEMVVGEGSVSPQKESGSPLFEDYVRIDQAGRLRVNVSIPTGVDGAYGFDTTIRKIGCSLNKPCYLSRTGSLVLQFDPVDKRMLCLFFIGTEEHGRVSASISPDATNTVGCFAHKDTVYLLVNGQESTGGRVQPSQELLTLRYNVGASSTSNTSSMFVGDVGRFRYWADPSVMRRVLTAGG